MANQPAGAALEVSRRKFGGLVAPVESNPTVGVAAAQLLGANPERVSVLFLNLSANSVYLSPKPNAATTNGIYLAANGGVFSTNADDDGVFPATAFYAIAGGAGSQMYILQMIRTDRSGGE